tara:strand:- start:2028 stop:3092 length:1065 start_codon:yes stop_codon:yes gene_type:complete
VFKCSPGKTYRFYNQVRNAKAVFLDIRGLEDIPYKEEDWNEDKILEIIADDRWSRELESRARGNQHVGTEGVGRGDKTRLGFLKALLFEAKRGDLIVVPAEGYDKDVLIGELIDDAGDFQQISATDDETEYVYLGRRVKWRSASPKRLLSEEMIRALHTQTAFFQLKRSFHEEIYKLAYRNFIFRGDYVSEFRTSKLRFTAEDHAVVSTWLNGFDVLRNSVEMTNPTNDVKPSFFELGLQELDDSLAAEVQIDIQSPGEVFVKSFGPFALALMAFFPLAGCDSQAVVDQGVTVKLKTVGGGISSHTEVQECVNSMAIALGHERLDQSSQLCDRAIRDAKMTTQAVLKSGHKESK